MDRQSRIIGTLLILLLIALLAAAALLWLLPGTPEPETELETVPQDDLFLTDVPPTDQFNVSVFDQAAYQALNLQLINDASLPVQPPASAGKANPFL